MQPIIYDVAVSADGFISGPDDDVSAFPMTGSVVDDYLKRLQSYQTVIMGRATYEFGYRYGMAVGANPYGHARTIVVSSRLALPQDASVEVRRVLDADWLDELRANATSPIYLCGGGILASAVVQLGRLSILRIKRAPVLIGAGIPLFAPLRPAPTLELIEQVDHGKGLLYQEFRVKP